MDNIVSKDNGSEDNNTGRGGEVFEPTVTFNSPTRTETTENQASRSRRSKRGHSSSRIKKMRGSRIRSSSSISCSTHGSVSVCGKRREMENTVTVKPCFFQSSLTTEIENETFDFYVVYDGHGGFLVAKVCKDRLHQLLADEIHEMSLASGGACSVLGGGVNGGNGKGGEEEVVVEGSWERMMKSPFMKMDEEIIQSGIDEEMGSTTMKSIGSTAVVAVVSKEKLLVANCGDSRVVLCCGGVAAPLSIDNKPNKPDGLERVEAAGGILIDWNGYRVLDVLATSRSLGDYYFKPYVISEPEVTVMDRTTNDEFMILVSDGLWDVMSNEIVCDVVRRCLDGRIRRRLSTNVEGNNVGATVLAELAMATGNVDNISVIVIELS